MDVVSLISAVITAIATTMLGILGLRLTRSTERNNAERAIGDLANTMAAIRLEHPDAMCPARSWTSSLWPRLYSGEDSTLVRYYAYVDVGLEFCNTVLRAAKSRQISKDAYDRRYRRMMVLFLTENWPIISSIHKNPFVSGDILELIDDARRRGWDWEHRHSLLAQPAPPP